MLMVKVKIVILTIILVFQIIVAPVGSLPAFADDNRQGEIQVTNGISKYANATIEQKKKDNQLAPISLGFNLGMLVGGIIIVMTGFALFKMQRRKQV